MLIPDNVHPDETIYYNGSIVLKVLQQYKAIDFLELYMKASQERKFSMSVFILCLDWLYLIDLIAIGDNGKVSLCS
jgi:hypothetical protein